MGDVAKDLDISEAGLSVLLLAGVSVISLSFCLGVHVGRTSAAASIPAATLAPPGQGRGLPAATPPGAPAERRPGLPPGFIGPPPPLPQPVGGAPGASLRGRSESLALEVMSVTDLDLADRQRRQLLQHGFPAYLVPGPDSAGTPRYRVRVGDYESEAQAARVVQALSNGEGLAARTIR